MLSSTRIVAYLLYRPSHNKPHFQCSDNVLLLTKTVNTRTIHSENVFCSDQQQHRLYHESRCVIRSAEL